MVHFNTARDIKIFIELERTLSSLIILNLLLENNSEAYSALVELQPLNEKLSYKSYSSLCELVHKVVSMYGHETIKALLIYGDLGKIKIFRDRGLENGVKAKDHDDWIENVLNLNPETIEKIIPRFKNLEKETQKTIIEAAKLMHIHFGHVLHLEGGSKMFERFKAAVSNLSNITGDAQTLLELALLVQYCDVAGALAHMRGIHGSVTLNENCYSGYQIVQKGLQLLISGGSEIEALEICVNERAKLLGIKLDTPFEKVAVRLACQLRLYTSTQNQTQSIIEAIEKLDDKSKKVLIEQFDLYGGFNNWLRNPTYLPAVLLNIYNWQSGVLTMGERIQNAVCAAACIAKLFDFNKKEWQQLTEPVNLNQLAGLVSKNPSLFLDAQNFDSSVFTLNEKLQVVLT